MSNSDRILKQKKVWLLLVILLIMSLFVMITKTHETKVEKYGVQEIISENMKSYSQKNEHYFVLVTWNNSQRVRLLDKINEAANQEKVIIMDLNLNSSSIPVNSSQTDFGVDINQKLDSLAFYSNGKMKDEISLVNIKDSEDFQSVINFIKANKK
ncbi:hypothetical protein C6Y02_17055 [Bacillus sp. NMCC4]|uniref:hypothetical protein n=2 Tax=Bacillus TaxID=1386 RepID=UPI000D031AB9|nr:hypothetical protein [Bacillus pumilus]PRS35720.1 hypothetical protein C6Y02_17055 [Bacillus sp. NMCC4]UUD44655.1 hypothetical protein NPA43_18630 [Bacillus pumilus]